MRESRLNEGVQVIKQDRLTFFILLHDGGRRGGHLHGQPIGSTEGVAVTDNEGPWLLVLQECNGCIVGRGKASRHRNEFLGAVVGA